MFPHAIFWRPTLRQLFFDVPMDAWLCISKAYGLLCDWCIYVCFATEACNQGGISGMHDSDPAGTMVMLVWIFQDLHFASVDM